MWTELSLDLLKDNIGYSKIFMKMFPHLKFVLIGDTYRSCTPTIRQFVKIWSDFWRSVFQFLQLVLSASIILIRIKVDTEKNLLIKFFVTIFSTYHITFIHLHQLRALSNFVNWKDWSLNWKWFFTVNFISIFFTSPDSIHWIYNGFVPSYFYFE